MEKINIAELLKDCPTGMELDCTISDNVVFEKIEFDSIQYPIVVRKLDTDTTIFLTKYGQYVDAKGYKCVIFPKGKTTWEGFVPPCRFKDGDVVYTSLGNIALLADKLIDECFSIHCILIGDTLEIAETFVRPIRFATEEEKQELFQAIKDNGYKWNEETKTLERLITPKFKVGDRVRNKNYKVYIYEIHDIVDKGYSAKEINADYPILILFGSQEDNYELVPNKFDITTLKPFDKVLARSGVRQKWIPDFFGFMDNDRGFPFVCVRYYVIQCIPFVGNEHLLGTTDDCDEYYKTWEEKA